ncbi:MAG: dTDP-4-amino-4,6-dideoxygalactose transaminase, partial [Bdellovibrionales bacterium]|nr:dTDP-4-amino-4,6-dideoxygalactose transaminase [Bdellovibrionales bacterium]
RGGKPVFIDIRPDTLNMDENQIEGLITSRTKAICPVHYAGVGCEMDTIMAIAKKHNLLVIEDAAHGVMAKYNNRYLGTIGHIGTFSFHETKNYSSGEGGALLLNDRQFGTRAEILREKGTNRSQFFRGEVDKYTWVDIGGSYLPSEIIAAFLYGQLEQAHNINNERLSIWNTYNDALAPLQERGDLRLPIIPENCEHNAHMFYILTESLEARTNLIHFLKQQGVSAVFHYVPLHSSPMGKSLGNKNGDLPVTEELSDRIVRLPLFCGLTSQEQERICSAVIEFYTGAQQISPLSSEKMVSNA